MLVDSIVELQKEGRILPAEPLQLARYIWALVHGIAMLAIDGRLRGRRRARRHSSDSPWSRSGTALPRTSEDAREVDRYRLVRLEGIHERVGVMPGFGLARSEEVKSYKGRCELADLAKLLDEALRLDVQDRAALAERLLASLDDLRPEEADRLWAEEAQRRLVELREGHARAIPAGEVHEKAERLLR